MSEAEPTSDKEEPKKQERVRSYVNFGQGKAKRARQCLKPSGLQTRRSQRSKSESEAEPTSDKEEPRKQERVRSYVNFGQGKAKRARQCLKPSRLQTRKSQKSKSESEAMLTSDKAKRKEQGSV
ncbi:hypothetical protein [Neobacillus sp. LXY-1]|uniref:hypothetical protein n=1 Tax=Neobacillus sp. LXY-1 TaxID=3379133 RepID=UPI003EDEAEE8